MSALLLVAALVAFPGPRCGGLDDDDDIGTLELVVCAECLSCTEDEQAAVASVVLNRVASPLWPPTVIAVVVQEDRPGRRQFAAPSAWCYGELPPRHESDGPWSEGMKSRYRASIEGIERAVARVVQGGSTIGDATRFHAVWMGKLWRFRRPRHPKHWEHLFYRPRLRWRGHTWKGQT